MDLITAKSHAASLPSLSTEAMDEGIPPEKTISSDPAGPAIAEDEIPLRIFVFDAQRTSSQLFNRQLLSHLRFGSISNPYALAATLGAERIHPKLRNNDRAVEAWEEQVASAPPRITSLTYQRATENFLREADRLEAQGKILFVREQSPLVMKHDIILSSIHSTENMVSKFFNPTCLPDELLRVVTPIIFIRHPARVIPSWLREANGTTNCYTVDDDDLTLWTSARWSRMIFDYLRSTAPSSRPPSRRRRNDSFLSQRSVELPMVACYPIVIDAADVMDNTHATLATLCRILDVDVADAENTWNPTQKFQRAYEFLAKTISENLLKAFSDRLRSSDGYSSSQDKPTASNSSSHNIDLDVEQRSWTKEFGAETARALRRKVEEDLPHYQYLRNFKLRARPSLSQVTFKDDTFGAPLRSLRSSIDASRSSFWADGNERPSQPALSDICRSASLGQMPVGVF